MCGVWAGVDVSTSRAGAGDRSRAPQTSAPRAAGGRDAREGVPHPSTAKPGRPAPSRGGPGGDSGASPGSGCGVPRAAPAEAPPAAPGPDGLRWAERGPLLLPPLSPAPARHGGLGARAPAPPAPSRRPAAHHRSSSRLSFCRLPDCTPWAPRPPPPPGSSRCCCCRRRRPGSAGTEKGWGVGGGGRPAGKGRRRAARRGRGQGSERRGGGAESTGRGEAAAPTRSAGEGEGRPNHLRRPRGAGARPLPPPPGVRRGHAERKEAPSALRQGPPGDEQLGEGWGKYSHILEKGRLSLF